MKRVYVLLVVLLTVGVLLSCRLEPGAIGPSPEEPGEETIETGVTLTIPALSPTVAKALGILPESPPATSRAIMIINTVELDLVLADVVVDTLSVDLDVGPDLQAQTEWNIPAATGYTIRARIYNTETSPTTPVLYGVSPSFDVISGETTEVSIRPVPAPPITLTPATIPLAPSTVTASSVTSCFETGETRQMSIDWGDDDIEGTADDTYIDVPVYGWREERWFELDAGPYDAIRVSADPDASSAVFFSLADSGGSVRTQGFGGGIGDFGPAYWEMGGVTSVGVLTPGSQYFLGLITYSDTGASVESTVVLSFEAFADDVYEENDSIAEAASLDMAVEASGIDLDPVYYDDFAPPTGGDWFTFTLAVDDDPNIDIELVFDHDDNDLFLALFDDAGDWVDESDDSVVSGPSDPDALEAETISETLVPGDYYILVGSSGWGWSTGSSYQLTWTAGQGTVDIGFE